MFSYTELQSMSLADLQSELQKARKTLLEANFRFNSGVSVALHEVRKSKKYVAQILTAISYQS